MTISGIKTQIWNNNLKSILLLATYPVLLAAIIWILTASFAKIGFIPHQGGAIESANNVLAKWWPAILAAICIWFCIAWFMQTRMVRALSHSHSITRKEEPALYNMLENLCIAEGMAMPRLEIIETHARNAFASGTDKNSYCITLTRGLLNSMEPDEVEAVIGHELTHIRHGDVRLLIISVIFTGMIGFFAQLIWSQLRYNLFSFNKNRKNGATPILLFVALILWAGYFATMFTRFALSRKREFMADAGSIELTRNPEAMMRALMRLSGKDKIPQTTDDIALMCIENSRKFFGLFATHPPMDQRIIAISQASGVPIPHFPKGMPAPYEERFSVQNAQNSQKPIPWLSRTRRARKMPWS